MEFLESFVAFTNDILWSYVLIVMLVGLGIWFSLGHDLYRCAA